MLLKEKLLNPTKFASHWEMDDEDIDEASEEEKQSKCIVYLICSEYWHDIGIL